MGTNSICGGVCVCVYMSFKMCVRPVCIEPSYKLNITRKRANKTWWAWQRSRNDSSSDARWKCGINIANSLKLAYTFPMAVVPFGHFWQLNVESFRKTRIIKHWMGQFFGLVSISRILSGCYVYQIHLGQCLARSMPSRTIIWFVTQFSLSNVCMLYECMYCSYVLFLLRFYFGCLLFFFCLLIFGYSH